MFITTSRYSLPFRKNMEIILLMTFIFFQQVAGSSYFVITQPMTALQAYNACDNENSTLAGPKSSEEEEILAYDLNGSRDFGAWTGNYVDVAPWVYAKHCWAGIDGTPLNLTTNSGSLCLQTCDPNTFIALVQKHQCICISDWFVQARNLDYAPQAKCNSVCNGDGGRCGGQQVYTQYSRCYGKDCPVDFNLEYNCAYVNLSGSIKAASCEEQHFPVCVIGKGQDETLEMFVNATYALEKKSWNDSNTFCRRKGGVLANVRGKQKSLERIAKELDITNSKPTFWVAINRANTPTKQITGNSTFSKSSQCFYTKHDGSGISHKNCDDKAFASCRKKLDNSSPVLTDTTTSQTNDSSSEDTTSVVKVTGPTIVSDTISDTNSTQTKDDSSFETESTPGVHVTGLFIVDNSSPVLTDTTTSQTNDSSSEDTTSVVKVTGPTIGYIILAVVVGVAALIGIIIGTSVLLKRRMKSKSGNLSQSRPQYDYSDIAEHKSPNTSGIQLQVLGGRSTGASGSGSNTSSGHEIRNMDEENYDIMVNHSRPKRNSNSNASESNTYHSVAVGPEGDYNELQIGQIKVNVEMRDSFYATAQSLSAMEGNYDEFQKRDGHTETESDYGHTFHFHD
ncbi:uncharacterized protein LOC117322455 isoform X2 [Pecten maximus]|uniref:uncharacterized protein LOC117322455 isoform X2 n=1 Tax=Pecten maximus TaxID=6579 RepID=UPI0014591B8D|nr:uncharacterized protein LOC117322455 isoform X2 [Pecten maximus]